MAPKGRRGLEIDVDPDLIRGTRQSQAWPSQRAKSTQRPGSPTPAVTYSTPQAKDGIPNREAPKYQPGSAPNRSQSGLGLEIDPDLVASTSQLGRSTPTQQETPIGSSGAAALRAQAGRYFTPGVRNQVSRFSSSAVRGRTMPTNDVEVDDIDESSPESRKGWWATTQSLRHAQAPRMAGPSIAFRQHSDSRALSSKPQPGLPPLVGSRPLRAATDDIDIDDDSIHSSSPPQRIPDSMDRESPRKVPEAAMKPNLSNSEDENSLSSSEDENAEVSRNRYRHLTPDIIKEQAQLRQPPKFTFKSERRPEDRSHFPPAPVFTFKPKLDPKYQPNPKKYIFKEDIRLPSTSSPPVPEPEPAPEAPRKKSKKAKEPLLKHLVPNGLVDSLRTKMSIANNTLPERLATAGLDDTLLEVDLVQHCGARDVRYWLVRGRLKTGNHAVCLILPGNGPHVYPKSTVVEGRTPEVVYNPVTTGCTIGVKGLRWMVELERVKWTVAPDWFIVSDRGPEVRRDAF